VAGNLWEVIFIDDSIDTLFKPQKLHDYRPAILLCYCEHNVFIKIFLCIF